ncbi:MAG: hypothetical protein EOO38_24355 [Cytophagaceae bacterium]|nr:MAG: hypothetical protein EOO38_24355 [Cytophagaceae bacterium]
MNNCTGVGTTILRAQGKPRYETYYGMVAAILNILITLALIRSLGLNGVVIGTIAGNVFGSVFFLYLFHKNTQIPWWPSMGRWLTKLMAVAVSVSIATYMVLEKLVGTEESRLKLFSVFVVAGVLYLIAFGLMGRATRFWTSDDIAFFERTLSTLKRRLRGAY